ncbi:sporulation specific N-acetylmuramoyl-L-alanine amidase [Neobacillus bataviensis LMG 21833]|uniref:Sporulation specific N-acetylmuramoyl-L-alanine amidase n=1 Tax=Neobacillus bataviensis LMG 21833 TaxID=1117379 RepID=K6DPB1_9BACI|nr:N-acetylmuramoyl-L-alanine amidase [Neobacillus bataviensis]EKN70174.1 sporulation specific N-acetylmuramoyl-L-alanine amidase [Neobacillus bataviensis LMG 21833]
MKLYLDPGHGGTDPGAQGNGLNEKDVTLDIALKLRSILTNSYEDIEIKMSRSADITKSLSERTSEANNWGANYFLAIHINAAGGSAEGYEDYIYSGLSDSSTTAKYQEIIHGEVIKMNQLKDRGRKKANFHVLRESAMDALLSENGFIDNPNDAALMKQDSWRQAVAQGHANGIASAFNLKRKANNPPEPANPGTGTLYKVIAGSFQSRENANERVAFLGAKGIDAFVNPTIISGKTWYRVQAGAYSNCDNAEEQVAVLKQAGIADAFIAAENSSPAQVAAAVDSILGPTRLSAEQMNSFVKTVNPDALELGSFYQEFGEYYGIRGDIAFAQALHETNYFRFTGIVRSVQNNYAGIGATGADHPGASFADPKEGVLAQFQHLFAYASTAPLPPQYPLVDPRFQLVERGSAPKWTDLNGKWAVPGKTYGQSILDLYERMVNSTV